MKKKEIDPRVTFVQREFAERVKERENLERNWLLNLNFYCGNQQAEVLATGEIVNADKKYKWQENEVFNHIAPIIEARLAKFSNIRAAVSVVPSTNDDADVMTAKFSTKLLRATEEENNFRKLVSDANFWSELTGTAFFKVVWSQAKGKCVSEKENVCEGDVEISVCPPYEIYPDSLTCDDISACRSIIHAKAYPVSVVEDIWGVRPKTEPVSVISADCITADGNNTQRGRNQLICGTQKDDYVTVLEWYSLPDGDNPDGRLMIVAGDRLLHDGVLPYKVGEDMKRGFPFVRQACVSRPSAFFGTSLIERMIPVQRAYNAVKNRKHEFFNRMTAGVLVAEDGSIDLEELEENGIEPGKVLVYRQGSNAPSMENVGSVPKEFGEEEDRLLSEFVSISGVSDFLLSADYSTTNMSGTALRLIMQQDDNRLALVGDNIRYAAKEVAKLILRLYKQYASISRLKRFYGENGSIETKSFSASDISCADIRFDFENETVNSVELRKETVKEVFEMGLLHGKDGVLSDETRLKLVGMLGLGNWENASCDDELHSKKAIGENEKICKEAPEVESIDNHSIHIAEHTRYLLQENCPLDKETRSLLIKHIEEHKKYKNVEE